MVSFPALQIRQQNAKLGIDADFGKQELRQPQATFEMKQVPASLEIRQPNGEMKIDQSKAWDALGLGGVMETTSRIKGEAYRVALQGIARIVENGNRMAAIHNNTNAIADIAEELHFEFFEFDYCGPASYDNVDVYYTLRKPEINVKQGGVELRTHPNPPEHNYTRGKLDIYLLQNQSIEITLPKIDTRI